MNRYQLLLQDRRWLRKRDKIRIRDDYRCVRCGCSRNDIPIDVHHKFYRWADFTKRKLAMPWECYDSDLETLCRPCHRKHHYKPPAPQKIAYSALVHGRQVGESQQAFEVKRRKVLEDLDKLRRENDHVKN